MDRRAILLLIRSYLYAHGLELADLQQTLQCSYENLWQHIDRRAAGRKPKSPSRCGEMIDAIIREAIAWRPHNGTNSTEDTILSLIVKSKNNMAVIEVTDAPPADAEDA